MGVGVLSFFLTLLWVGLCNRKCWPNLRIKPRMYVRRSIIYEKAAFVLLRKISSVACGFSSIKMHYSLNRINGVYVFFLKNILKNINFIHILWNFVTACFAAIELVIVLAWFL